MSAQCTYLRLIEYQALFYEKCMAIASNSSLFFQFDIYDKWKMTPSTFIWNVIDELVNKFTMNTTDVYLAYKL